MDKALNILGNCFLSFGFISLGLLNWQYSKYLNHDLNIIKELVISKVDKKVIDQIDYLSRKSSKKMRREYLFEMFPKPFFWNDFKIIYRESCRNLMNSFR